MYWVALTFVYGHTFVYGYMQAYALTACLDQHHDSLHTLAWGICSYSNVVAVDGVFVL